MGFYGEHGKPSCAIINGASLSFWPDEWKKVLGGNKAVSHYIQVFTPDGIWIGGKIVQYDKEKDKHTIRIESDMCEAADNSQIAEVDIAVCLEKTPHQWVDTAFKHKVQGSTTSSRLQFTTADIGRFIRIWWSRYNKYYYGRIISYEPSGRTHTVIYEDADVRSYDMMSRDYEVVNPPADLVIPRNASDAEASKITANWHRSQKDNTATTSIGGNTDDVAPSLDSGKELTEDYGVPRPPASQAYHTSMYQLKVIRAFFREGGADSMFQALCDTQQAPPIMRILLLHLQFLYQMRNYVSASKLKDLVWEAKEGIPYAITRYDDVQLKDFSIKDFNDVFISVKDLVVFASNSSSVHRKGGIQDALEILRLTVASKLLVCSQLQKRYLGLSIIKEIIETVEPKINLYVARRYQTLLKKQDKVEKGVSNRISAYSGATSLKTSLSAKEIDAWIISNMVIEKLFGESLHRDLVARSDVLIAYMAHRRILTEQHVSFLWKSSVGMHETVLRVLHQLILVIIPVMEPSLRMYLFSLMEALTPKDYTEQILHLIKAYTVQSLIAIREEKSILPTSTALEQKNEISNAEAVGLNVAESPHSDGKQSSVNSKSATNRKGLVVNAPQRLWMGFGVLWQFVQDPAASSSNGGSVDEDLIELAIQLLVELLEEEFAEERELVMHRCLANIQVGISVPVSLQILRRTLNLYPSAQKGWFGLRQGGNKVVTVTTQINNLLKNHRLLEIVFIDLDKYYQSIVETDAIGVTQSRSQTDLASFNDRRIQINGKVGRMSHLKGIVERLEFLKFIISRSDIRLDLNQTQLLWKVLAENAVTIETSLKLFDWLNNLVNQESKLLTLLLTSISQESSLLDLNQPSVLVLLNPTVAATSISQDGESEHFSAFEEGVPERLFEDCLMKWVNIYDKINFLSKVSVASFSIKLFLLVNINNKSLRVDPDGSWYRQGNLTGLPLLWRLALDAIDKDVSMIAITLLVELYHRVPHKVRSIESTKGHFLRLCFQQLKHSMQALNDGSQSESADAQIEGIPEDVFADRSTNISVKSTRISRTILCLKLFIQRFSQAPVKLLNLKVIAGRDDSPTFSLTVPATATIDELRKKIADYFKESPTIIMLMHNIGKNQVDRLEKGNMTIAQAKIMDNDAIIARKKDVVSISMNKTGSPSPESTTMSDVLHPYDLSGYLNDMLSPIAWIYGYSVESSEVSPVFRRRSFPVKSHADLRNTVKEGNKGNSAEFLSPFIRSSPEFVDQLLEMLDGYLSMENTIDSNPEFDLSEAVFDVLQSLPTNSQLLNQIEEIAGDARPALINRLFDLSCPYRLFYTLQIIDSIFDSDDQNITKKSYGSILANKVGVIDWVMKFAHLGGIEKLVELLDTISSRISKAKLKKAQRQASKTDEDYSLSRNDLEITIFALITRILHNFLLFDPSYALWQTQEASIHFTADNSDTEALTEKVPQGILFSCMDAAKLISNIISCCYRSLHLFEFGHISASAFATTIDSGLQLVFGLVTAVSDGPDSLRSSSNFSALIRKCGTEIEATTVRQALTKRLFEVCANILKKLAEPTILQEQKAYRVELFDYLFHIIMSSIVPDFSAQLASAMEADEAEPVVKQREKAHTAVHALPNTVKEMLTLIAAVETLRITPGLIHSPNTNKMEIKRSSDHAPLVLTAMSGVGNSYIERYNSVTPTFLCKLFVDKLINHHSRESFHSSDADGTLLGILRVLLVLSNERNSTRKFLGKLKLQLANCGGDNYCSHLLDYLYNRCLFPSATISPHKRISMDSLGGFCQTHDTRSLVYAIVYSLCNEDTDNLARFVSAMNGEDKFSLSNNSLVTVGSPTPIRVVDKERTSSEQTGKIKRKTPLLSWDYDPSTLVKDGNAYVGLCNQGGTCYMNSLLQQLYHSNYFREGLLRIAGNSKVEQDNQHEAMLFQLQVMFGYLKLSQKKYYDTLPFCRSFLDYDGQPISLSEQKDIYEFAGMLFEKLEHNPECAELLAKTIRGKVVWKTKSTETAYRSEREENFYMITVEVKDKSSLEDSLDLTIAEEFFSGDNKIEDSDTGRKVDALRRCAIRELPPTLIIHLKRFEFDLETLNRKKVNDNITFPMDLDMFPFTEEGIAAKEVRSGKQFSERTHIDESEQQHWEEDSSPIEINKHPSSYYIYSLKGVVAHVGAIDRGHYYSFIRDKKTNKWMEFNDRNVLPFSVEAIPSECFGGFEEVQTPNGIVRRMRENSAYLLIYERNEDVPRIEEEDAIDSLNSSSSSLLNMSDILLDGSINGDSPIKVSTGKQPITDGGEHVVAPHVLETIWTENAEFQKDRFLFDPTHFRFMWQIQNCKSVFEILHSSDEGEDSETKQVLANLSLSSLKFNVEVLARARAHSCVQIYFERLEEIISHNTNRGGAIAILNELSEDNPEQLVDVLLSQKGNGQIYLPDRVPRSNSISSPKSQQFLEREYLEKTCHPWLLQLFHYCPHPNTTKSFARFLIACIKAVREQFSKAYLALMTRSPKSTSNCSDSKDVLEKGEKIKNVIVDSGRLKDLALLTNPVSKVVNKLIILAEKFQIEDVIRKDGEIHLKLSQFYLFIQLSF